MKQYVTKKEIFICDNCGARNRLKFSRATQSKNESPGDSIMLAAERLQSR
jgi:hypothetical protein